nr:hypothetical protein [Tanacetum cinerariifolium]
MMSTMDLDGETFLADDENKEFDDEEYDDLYKDVNVRSKVAKHEEVGKRNVEMTDTTSESGSQEKSYEQVIEDAHLTLTTSQKTEGLKQSSSVSSDFASKFLILDNVPPVVDEVASMMNVMVRQEESRTRAPLFLSVPVTTNPETSTVPAITVPLTIQPFTSIPQQSTPTLEPPAEPSTTLIHDLPNFSSLFGFDHRNLRRKLKKKRIDTLISLRNLLRISSKMKLRVHSLISYLRKYQTLPLLLSKVPLMNHLRTSSWPNLLLNRNQHTRLQHLTAFELKKILLDKIQKSKSYQTAPEHKELYDALVKSYKLNKDLFESYGNTYSLKRDRDDKAKDEDPSVGSDRGLKKRKTSKDTEPTKDSDMSQNQEGNLGNDDEEPMGEVASKPDTYKPLKTFDELMSTPIDFSAYIMNGLNITNLTQETLLGPAFKLLKGTRTNFAELEYDFEECYKALSEKLNWDNPECGGISTMTYTTSTTKTKAAQYDLPSIEDMVPNIWSPVKVAYDKHVKWGISHWREQLTRVEVMQKHRYGYLREIELRRADNELYTFKEGDFPRLRINDIEDMLILVVQNRLTNLSGNDIFDFSIALQMFTESMVIQERVEDLQKLPEEDQHHQARKNMLMRSDKLYKFSDGTLTRLRTSLGYITKNIQMEYLPQRRWSSLEKKRAHIMIKAIDKQLKERRMMRSLAKFVGGRYYGTDLRLLQRTT